MLKLGARSLKLSLCVLCLVSCVLCLVSCVLCLVSCVLCLVSCVLCLVSCVLRHVSCVLRLTRSARLPPGGRAQLALRGGMWREAPYRRPGRRPTRSNSTVRRTSGRARRQKCL